MKQTPFYEISIALQGRPRMFRIIVIACLHVCFLVLLQYAGILWEETFKPSSASIEKKAPNQFLPAKNVEARLSE